MIKTILSIIHNLKIKLFISSLCFICLATSSVMAEEGENKAETVRLLNTQINGLGHNLMIHERHLIDLQQKLKEKLASEKTSEKTSKKTSEKSKLLTGTKIKALEGQINAKTNFIKTIKYKLLNLTG